MKTTSSSLVDPDQIINTELPDNFDPTPSVPKKYIMPAFLLFFVFLLSGAAALIYESSWNRQVGLYLGNTTQSSSIVLCSFFLGMALGYRVGNLWPKKIHPLLGYGLLEITAGCFAMLFPTLLAIAMNTFDGSSLTGNHYTLLLQNSLIVFICLLPSTVSLGATLPLMSKSLSSIFPEEKDGSKISFAYGINTIGAVVGLLVSSYFLFLWCGVRGSSYLAAFLSIFCGCLAIILSRFYIHANRFRNSKTVSTAAIPISATIVAMISGSCALALEVLYLRLFSLVFHNSTYTFGTVLAVFLLALATGSMIVSRIPKKRLSFFLGIVTFVAPLAILLSLWIMYRVSGFNYFIVGDTFFQYISAAFGFVFLVVFPPVTLCGFLLPGLWKLLATQEMDESSIVAKTTMWNSTFAALGAIVGNFLLFPITGLFGSFAIVASILAIPISLVPNILEENRNQNRPLSRIPLFRTAIVITLVGCGGTYLHYNAVDAKEYRRTIVHRWNSVYGWVDIVKSRAGSFQVSQNLHYRHGSTGSSKQRQRRQSLIPLMLHPNPKDTLFLGLGTGVTASSAVSLETVKSIEIVELIPEVVEAVSTLNEQNLNVLDNQKTNVICDDARHFLRTREKQYDVIVADLFVPWESQTGYLYTEEHYKTIGKRLRPDGYFFQCLAVYQLGDQQLNCILDSMKKEFPHLSLWWINLSSSRPILGALGSKKPISLDNMFANHFQPKQIYTHWGQNHLPAQDRYLKTKKDFSSCYIGDWEDSGQEIYNTDEYPVIEFTTPKAFGDDRLLSGRHWLEYYQKFLHNLKADGAVKDFDPRHPFGEMREIHLYLLKDGRHWN